jgi:tight adherence protein B
MMIMPYGIILYLRLTNGDFLEVLYHNVLGGALMTLFLIVIHLADMWAKKVMEIRV